MMDSSSLFDDDFDVPGAQPSGSIHVSDAPDLSQSAWYDLEDEDVAVPSDDEDDEADASALFHQQASMRTVREPGVGRAGLASPSSATSGGWRRVFSIRNSIIFIVIFALLGGVAFARGFVSLPTTNAQKPPQSTMQQGQKSIPPAMQQGQKSIPPAVAQRQKAAQPAPVLMPTQAVPASTGTLATIPAMSMQNVPADWSASGRGMGDMLEALSVAETFTQRYETIDFRSPATFSSARFILTNAANQRFAAQDKHSTDAFVNQVQQQQLVQAAFVTGAQLVQAQNQNGNFFAWITVSYQFATQQGTGTAVTNSATMTVLLVAAPFNTPADAPPMGGIGWLITNYGDGNALPTIPATP